jgi:hypothetical protein
MDHTQPSLRTWVADQALDVEWIFGRDGALTALDEHGRWWAGCSLPMRAAQAMLARLELRGAVACLLAPSHAGQIRAALDQLRPEQAIVAIVPQMRDLAFILHADDFAAQIAAHRLWFAAGPAWDVGLRQIFDHHPGLATPVQFIRMQDADAAVVDEMISSAQKIFGEIGTTRASMLQAWREQMARPGPTRSRPRICVVAPSRFRLWNDLSGAMLGVFRGRSDVEVAHFDCDDPVNSSPLALLNATAECDIIFTANTGRSDLPGLVNDATPWITWVTAPRVPSSALAGADDHLIVVDSGLRDAAIKSGWPAARVHVATWPALAPNSSASPTQSIALIADTRVLDTPEDLTEYSSQGLLWEAIRNELAHDPLVLEDVNGFLVARMKQLGVSCDTLPRARFIDQLIIPAYQQGLATILLANKIPLTLHGSGWDQIGAFKDHACGAVQTREQFQQIVSESAALLHAWPASSAHPIDSLDVPIVRRTSRRAETLVRDARAALSQSAPATRLRGAPVISFELIQRILTSVGR